jgi:hypothetical protein
MMFGYYVITCSEDGDHHIELVSREELEERLNDEYYGSDPKYLTELNESLDLGYFSGLIIIKGEAIMPTAVEKITRLEL